jgi:hypothetical protein
MLKAMGADPAGPITLVGATRCRQQTVVGISQNWDNRPGATCPGGRRETAALGRVSQARLPELSRGRGAFQKKAPSGIRTARRDVDLVADRPIYSLRKWTRLALKGNPTIMLLLFTPEEQLVHCDERGAELRALTPSIVSRRVQGPFLGYLQAQKQRLTGERGQKRIHRPELEEMYGFDTKYAMHMLRLGFQGVELLTTGRLILPMREPARSFLLDVRRGKVSEQVCLTDDVQSKKRLIVRPRLPTP